MDQRAPLLLEEPTIQVYPKLAQYLGINEAIILQQLHFLLWITSKSKNTHNRIENRWWVYNSYEEWTRDHFPWLSVVTVKRHFLSLEDAHIVLSKQGVKNKSDRRKWYTIDYEAFRAFIIMKETAAIRSKCADEPWDQNDPMIGSKCADGYSDTTTDIKTTTSASADGVSSENITTKTEPLTKPRKPRKADPLFDAISLYLFEIPADAIDKPGGRIGKIRAWCVIRGVTADEVQWFCNWYHQEYGQLALPLDRDKFEVHFLKYRAAVRQHAGSPSQSQRDVPKAL